MKNCIAYVVQFDSKTVDIQGKIEEFDTVAEAAKYINARGNNA